LVLPDPVAVTDPDPEVVFPIENVVPPPPEVDPVAEGEEESVAEGLEELVTVDVTVS